VKRLHLARRLCQWGTLAIFILVPLLHLVDINVLSGNLLSFRAGPMVVMDPLAALQVAAITRTVTADMALGAGFVLLTAAILGPIFCGWLCPYGLLSELVHALRSRRDTSNPAKNTPPTATGNAPGPFIIKLVLLAAGFCAALLLANPILNRLSMGGWYSRFLQDFLLVGEVLWAAPVIIAAALAVEWALARRVWCRFLCPQSVPILLAGLLLPHRLRVTFKKKRCTCPASHRACLPACSLGLDPRSPGPGLALQCSLCGECVNVCREKKKALRLNFGSEADKDRLGSDGA
jgi:ferredoxin-type protein NapH